MHNHTDLEPCNPQCPVRWDPGASTPKEGQLFAPGLGWIDQPDFDEFAHNPLGYAKGAAPVEPTEDQERVARELMGFFTALKNAGFNREDAIATLGAIFKAKSEGSDITPENFTL